MSPIEVGVGSGYHALALASATGKHVVGYEIDSSAREFGHRALELINCDLVKVYGAAPPLESLVSREGQFVYFTCHLDHEYWSAVGRHISTSSVALGPTAIKMSEFEESRDSEYFRRYENYEQYLARRPPFLRLASWEGERDRSLVYDVTFVPFLETEPQKGIQELQWPEYAQWFKDTLLA